MRYLVITPALPSYLPFLSRTKARLEAKTLTLILPLPLPLPLPLTLTLTPGDSVLPEFTQFNSWSKALEAMWVLAFMGEPAEANP